MRLAVTRPNLLPLILQRRTPVFILRKKGRQIVLGAWPIMSVDQARDAAIDRLRGNHIVKGSTRFKDVVDDYLAAGRWRQKTRSQIERHLLEDARTLAERRFAEIDREEVADLLRTIQARGDATRNRVRATLSALWTYAIAEGKAELNVVQGTNRADEKSRDRVLTTEEIRTLWRGLPSSTYGDIVRLLLLTGQRRQEIAGLRRSEIVLDEEPRIELPAARTKANRKHVVPLSPQTIAILKPYCANGEALFNGWASFSFAKAALDKELGLTDYRIHDLRRSAATWISELGFAPR